MGKKKKKNVYQAFYLFQNLFQILKLPFQAGDICFTYLPSKAACGKVCHLSAIVIGIFLICNYIVWYKIIIIKHKGWIILYFEYTSAV